MRDISELIVKQKPIEKLTDAEALELVRQEDERMIREFTQQQPFVRNSIGKRPWT
jgi:hypothetical protein